MNRDDIIRFGEQADEIADRKINMRGEYHPKRLWFWRDLRDEAFAELVAAHEREECAKLCENMETHRFENYIGRDFAHAIRARDNV